ENEQRRIGRDSAREGEELPLPHADRGPTLPELLGVSVRQSANHSMRADALGGLCDVVVAQRARQPDVREYVPSEEENVLLHVTHERAQRVTGNGANVDAVHQDAAALRIIETKQEVDDRGLSCSSMPHERERLAGTDSKAHAPKHPLW